MSEQAWRDDPLLVEAFDAFNGAPGESHTAWLISRLFDRIVRDGPVTSDRTSELLRRYRDDSTKLNALCWAIHSEFGYLPDAATSQVTVNRETIVEDMMDKIRVALKSEFDRGYQEGCHDCY